LSLTQKLGERGCFAKVSLAITDLRAYMQALKDWGLDREKRFIREGWRKMKVKNI